MALDKRLVDLQWPSAGINRRYAHQRQPPYTSPEALNVRTDETRQGRGRGGQRPGLVRAIETQLGTSGNRLPRMLATVSTSEVQGVEESFDGFDGSSLGSQWSEASWSGGLPQVSNDLALDLSDATAVGAVYETIDNLDTSEAYEVGIYIMPWRGSHNGTYRLFARLNDTTPNLLNDGLEVAFEMTGSAGAYSGTLRGYDSGSLTSGALSSGSDGHAASGWLTLRIDGTTATVRWRGATIKTQNISTWLGANAGTRFGFGMESSVAGAVVLITGFRAQYKRTVFDPVRRNRLIASANGSLYTEDLGATMTAVTTDLTLASDRRIHAAERLQKLYIADHQVRWSGSCDAISGTAVDDSGVSDWTAFGIDPNDDVVVITEASGPTNGTYQIASVAAGQITLASTSGTAGSGTVFICRAPKIYDPKTAPVSGGLSIWAATDGQVPTGCPLIAQWRDRLVLAGYPSYAFYMSRKGDPLDWDYGQSDSEAAVAGGVSDVGEIGEPINALIPFGDDRMIFGCESSIWLLTGDPAAGGRFDALSRATGIVGSTAWCLTPSGAMVFLGRDGLFALLPHYNARPEPISRERLPRDLIDIDGDRVYVALAWDHRERGVHIWLGGETVLAYQHWFVGWESGSFWPVEVPDDFVPQVAISEPGRSVRTLFGSRDGYIRSYNELADTDEDTAITSYVDIGPFRPGASDFNEGRLDELIAVLAQESGSVQWSVRVAETAEETRTASNFDSGTFTEGYNKNVRPRARGASIIVRLEASGSRWWALERLTAVLAQMGRQR